MYIQDSDYSFLIRNEIKAIIAGSSPTAQHSAELAAQAEMESYLSTRYDVPAITSAIGEDRNQALLMYCIDMALYHLHSNISPRNIPQLRIDRYDQAIAWLKMVAKGDLNPNLPVLPGDTSYTVKVGSQVQRSKAW